MIAIKPDRVHEQSPSVAESGTGLSRRSIPYLSRDTGHAEHGISFLLPWPAFLLSLHLPLDAPRWPLVRSMFYNGHRKRRRGWTIIRPKSPVAFKGGTAC
jgi:hypothetical protein